MKPTLLLFAVIVFLTFKSQAQSTVTDIDGNVYNTVTIGTQLWLKENLKVTHYNNGDSILNVVNDAAWSVLTTGAFCNYENDPAFVNSYGRLYNWYALNDSRNIAPEGWHIATDAEWTTATNLLGGDPIAGGKLKEVGTTHWLSPNTGATDEVGFTALPGGYRSAVGVYLGIGWIGSWWCSTESGVSEAWARGIFNDNIQVDRGGYYEKKIGFSVRCVKNEAVEIQDQKFKNNVQIYPNPASDRIYLKNINARIVELKVFNLYGECMLHQVVTNGTTGINVTTLPNGIYIIEITMIDNLVLYKFIKE
jgi:uncharacterized protein (TIGR02145 family)